MKKSYIIAIIFILVFGCFIFVPSTFFFKSNINEQFIYDDYLRIHIRANSNDNIDQNVKYKVKDAFVSCLTPLLTDADTKQKAMRIILNNLNMLTTVANDVLKKNGFNYTANCSLKEENFPTRSYDGVTLPAGVYDALIVELGSASGNNWWCVVYPPMCFVDAGSDSKSVVYVSKLVQIINNFFKKG